MSDDFAKIILSGIYDGLKTQKILDKFKPIIQKSFNSYISDIVNQKIFSALVQEEAVTEESEVLSIEESASKIITTEEELQGFNIVRAIL